MKQFNIYLLLHPMQKEKTLFIVSLLFLIVPVIYSQDTTVVIKKGINVQDTSAIVEPDSIDAGLLDSLNFNLLIAASKGKASEAKEAIKNGAQTNCTFDGITPLMYASQEGHIEIVKLLLSSGAKLEERPYYTGITALIGSVINNQLDIADILIQNGANINAKAKDSVSSLLYAAGYGYVLMTDMLIFYGADINAKDTDGNNAIIIAAINGYREIVDSLIRKGADVNSLDNDGNTPLILASQNEHYDVVKLVLDNNADINAINMANHSALSVSAKTGNLEIFQLLLDKGADTKVKAGRNSTIYNIAMAHENNALVKILSKNSSNINLFPFYNKLSISFDAMWNFDDLLSGGSIGVIDFKYNTGFNFGYNTRYWPKRILVEFEENLYYQYWETRSLFYLNFEKKFSLMRNYESRFGLLIGAKEIYTYGNISGSYRKVAKEYRFVPQFGLYWTYQMIGTKINYEYLDLDTYKISPHWVNISLVVMINLYQQKKSKKKIDWL